MIDEALVAEAEPVALPSAPPLTLAERLRLSLMLEEWEEFKQTDTYRAGCLELWRKRKGS